MTAFRLVDLEESKVSDILKQMERFQPVIGHAILNKTGVIQVGENFKFDLIKNYMLFFLSQCHIPMFSYPNVYVAEIFVNFGNLFVKTMRIILYNISGDIFKD